MAIKLTDKTIMAGAAIGAFTQDPTDHPIAGVVGLGIGAYMGSVIKPQIIGNTIGALPESSRIKINSGNIEEKTYTSRSIADRVEEYDRRLKRMDNSSDVWSSLNENIKRNYNQIHNSDTSIDILSLRDEFRKMKSSGLGAAGFSDYIAKLGYSEDEMKGFLTASRTLSITKEFINQGKGKRSLVNGSVVNDMHILHPEAFKERGKSRPDKTISFGLDADTTTRESAVKDHLIKVLNTPEDVAERQAKNIANMTDGHRLEISGSNLKLTANGEISRIKLDEYKPELAGKYPIQSRGGDSYISKRKNPFMALDDSIQFPDLAIIGQDGKVKTVNNNSMEVRTQKFSPVEAALARWKFGGEDIKEVFKDSWEQKTRIGNTNSLLRNAGTNVNISELFAAADKTDIERQFYSKKGAIGGVKSLSYSDLADIHMTAYLDAYNMGYANVAEGVRNSETFTLSLGRERNANKAFSPDFVTHNERASDVQLSRGYSYSTSNDFTNKFINALNRNPDYNGAYGNATMLKVDSVVQREKSIADYILSHEAASLGDGQTLMRRSAMDGVKIGEAVSFDIGNINDGIILKTDQAKEAFRDLAKEYRKNGNVEAANYNAEFLRKDSIAITPEGKHVVVPDRYSSFSLQNISVDSDGNARVHGMGFQAPGEGRGNIKIFGDVKSTAVMLSDESFNTMALNRKLEDMGEIDMSTGHLSQRIKDELGVTSIDEYVHKFKTLSNDNIIDLSRKFNIDISADLMARADDLKLMSSFKSVPEAPDLARKFIIDKISSIDNDDSNVVKQHLMSYIDNANDSEVVAKSKGVALAIAGLSDSKSSRTLSASIALSQVDGNNFNPAAEKLFDLASYRNLAETQNSDGLRKLIDEAVSFGTAQYAANGNTMNLYTPSSVAFGVEGNIAFGKASASWMRMQALHNIGYSQDLLSQVLNYNDEALYEAKSILSSYDNSGKKMSEVFGESFDEQRRVVNALFDADTKRMDVARSMLGKLDLSSGILNITTDGNIEGMKSIPVNLIKTNRSGAFTEQGVNLLPIKDKLTRDMLLNQITLAEARESGDTRKISTAEARLQQSASSLSKIFNDMQTPISKEARKTSAKLGTDTLFQMIGGDAADIHKDMISRGQNVIFVNKATLSHMGFDIDKMSGQEFTSHTSNDFEGKYKGMHFMTMGDADNTPLYTIFGREPTSGEQTVQTARVVYAESLDSHGSDAVSALPEYSLSKSNASISAASTLTQDADGDALTLISLKNSNGKMIEMARQSEKLSAEIIGSHGNFMSALSAKTGKSGTKLALSADNIFDFDAVSKMLQGQERKHMAASIVELSTALNTSVNIQYKADLEELNKKFKIGTGVDLSGAEKIEYNNKLKQLRQNRFLSSILGSAYVEDTIKAIHSGGSGGGQAPIDIINDLRSKATSMSLNGYSDVSNYIHSELMNKFSVSAEKIDKELSAMGMDAINSATGDLNDAAEYIRKSFSNYGFQISENDAQMLKRGGGSNKIASVFAEVGDYNPAGHLLHNSSSGGIIPKGTDIRASIIQTVSHNKGKVLAGAAGLAATSFILGAEAPDMTSTMSNSPVARQSSVLPPMKQQTGYVTSPYGSNNNGGSVQVEGRRMPQGYSGNSGITNMINGDGVGRSTVRFQNSQGY